VTILTKGILMQLPAGDARRQPLNSDLLLRFVALDSLAGQTMVLALRITAALEQESLHVSLWGSPDAQNWGSVALFWFPQVFELGITPAALDLRSRPELKFLQARWEVNRWGRGNPRPHFEFSLEIQPAGT
jgi:hypothetical protein